jgi:protein-L-isoaspartate(D-aspartate) O-methyltransferase
MDIDHMLKSVELNFSSFVYSDNDEKMKNKILDAINQIDRQFFIKKKECVYIDTAISIGYNQTISQPSTVARMLMLINLKSGENILEIGSGSGWNANLLGFMTYPGKVLSLDIISNLTKQSRNNSNELIKNISESGKKRLSRIEFRCINILKQIDSWDEKYDKIIITAGIKKSQEKIIDRLAKKTLNDNGILVCPYIQGHLIIIKKINDKIIKDKSKEEYVFVPLLE